MKKFIFVMPLMAVSLLASCNKTTPTPEATYTITFKNDGDPDKKIENIKAGSIISEGIPDPITPKPDSIFVGWCTDTESKCVFDFSKIKINQDYTLYAGWKESESGTYTIDFDCKDCEAFDEKDHKVTRVIVPVVESQQTLYLKFHFEGSNQYKVPLKSDISIKKTGTEETVEYEYTAGNILVPVIGNLTISAKGSGYLKSLEESSWDEIEEISATGRADDFFDVGETKEVKLSENGAEQSFSHTVRIIDFNRDELEDGSKAGITFEFKDLITKGTDSPTDVYTTTWNGIYFEVGYYNYDYRESTLNDFLNDETVGVESVINKLPAKLSEKIKPVNKLVGVSFNEGESYTAIPFEKGKLPKLFPLAHDEIHNSGSERVTPGEAGDPATGGGIYKYYEGHGGDTDADIAYRVKKIVNGDEGIPYWLRSPCIHPDYNAEAAQIIGDDGNTYSDYVVTILAVAPAFCI